MCAQQLVTQVAKPQRRNIRRINPSANPKSDRQPNHKSSALSINKSAINIRDTDSLREQYDLNSPRKSDSESESPIQSPSSPITQVTKMKGGSVYRKSKGPSVTLVDSVSANNSHIRPQTILSEESKILNTKAPWKPNHLLPPLEDGHPKKGKKCLILDLDETLVHSSFQPVECDFKIPVEIEGVVRTIYVSKRPHVDEFLKECGELFEVVVFTASLAKYADSLVDLLDIYQSVDHRLFRESCTQYLGIFVKDLFRIGRPLTETIIIDNSPHSYAFNPQNAVPCESWFDDQNDEELKEILVHLRQLADPSIKDVAKELERMGVSGVGLVPQGFESGRPVEEEEHET